MLLRYCDYDPVVSPTEKSREFICLVTSSFPANGGRLERRRARERTCRAVSFVEENKPSMAPI